MRTSIARLIAAWGLLIGTLALGTAAAAATPTIRCVTTSGAPPPIGTASGCAATYGSIYAAISAAASGDTIYVFANTGATATNPTTYTEKLSIGTSLTLVGVGAVAINGGGNGTTVDIQANPVTLIGLTVTGGNGGVGGIFASGGTALTLIDVTVSGNTATTAGGGIHMNTSSTLTLVDSTIANNTVTADGLGGGGIHMNSLNTLTLVHSTVAGNTDASGYGGGGIYITGGTLTLNNSIVAGNNTSSFNPDVFGTITTNNASVVGDATGLGTLADNGGPTRTVAITAASPAHDNAACATNPATGTAVAADQRDLARPQGANCDAGAFELTAGPTPPAFPVGIATQILPPAITNNAYDQTLAITNGAAPYVSTLLVGTLPTGLSLSAGGTIAGSTTQTGTFPIVVKVTDAGQFADIRALSLTVQPLALVVNTTDDGTATVTNCLQGNAGTCRLRDAIEAINQGLVPASPTPTITFAMDGTIKLNSGTLLVSAPVSIDATGPAHAIVVDGGCTTCDPGGNPSGGVIVFRVTGGTAAQPVTLAGLTIRHGYGALGFEGGGINNSGTLQVTNSTVTANAAASNGGGIFNTGTLSVAGSMITNNSIYSSFRYGGTGIDNALSGTLTVTGSTITGNSGAPGAIQNEGEGATATVTNSTISGNDASVFGNGAGGLSNTGHLMTVVGSTISGNSGYIGGGINNFGVSLTVTNSTIAGNTASFRGGGIFAGGSGAVTLTNTTLSGNSATDAGGGITAQTNATVTLTNTIVANSTGGDLSVYSVAGGIFTGANNLIDDAATAASFIDGAGGNIVGHPALLGSLGNYGGATQTVPLLPGSPAIDKGAAVGSGPAGNPVPAGDQRGKPRLAAPDIGAFESQGFTLTPVAGSTPQSAIVGTAFAQPLALTVVANNAIEPVQGGVISFAATPAGNGATATLSVPTATIGAGGAASVTARANAIAGAYMVTASATGAASATFNLTNTAPLVSIAVVPNPVTLKVGQVQQFTATGTYADSSTADITAQVSWSSDAPSVVGVDATGTRTGTGPGTGTGKAAGTAHVTATQGTVSGAATVTVTPPVLTGVQPAPAPASRPSGASVSGTATPAAAPTGR